MATVDRKDWPEVKDWPKPGWKHALNARCFYPGRVFGWHEDGRLWSGIVVAVSGCSVNVRDVQPGIAIAI